MIPFRQIELRNTLPLETRDDTDPSLLYKAHTFSVPVDHFHNDSKYAPHSDASFPLRYWFDASHYRPGGPVFVLQSGETDATARLPFLQKGIVSIVAKATNGIGVILEHRYYGKSFPVPDLSTENMRFLTTQQALADEAYFAQHVQFPGLEEYDLTSKTTAWISYGGSYAGAFSAFLRVQYPHVFWGAISSSGVTKAIYDYWAYYKPIAEHAPAACVSAQQHLTNVMDNIWLQKNHTTLPAELKSTFGFADLTYDTDFASTLTRGIGNWQSLNWNPAVSSPEFYNYCDNITSTKVLWPETETKRANVSRLIQEGGYRASEMFENQMLNMIGYFNLTAIAPCVAKHETLDQCHSSHNETFYHLHSIDHGSWRSWPYQYCTEWGYLQTGNTPANRLPLISRTLTLEHETVICREAFNITDPPDVGLVNEYGGYDISYPRLAFVDGQWDPWREATPHAFE